MHVENNYAPSKILTFNHLRWPWPAYIDLDYACNTHLMIVNICDITTQSKTKKCPNTCFRAVHCQCFCTTNLFFQRCESWYALLNQIAALQCVLRYLSDHATSIIVFYFIWNTKSIICLSTNFFRYHSIYFKSQVIKENKSKIQILLI